MPYRFDDLLVAEVRQSHEAYAENQKEKTTSFGTDPNAAEITYVDAIMHNGVLVTPQLKAFMNEIAKVFRGVEFYAHSVNNKRTNMPKWRWSKMHIPMHGVSSGEVSVKVAHEVAVAYPNDRYCIGIIGYGDYQKSTNDYVYVVSSRTIENNKYASHSDEYHFLMSSDINRAVKNARTYLRQYNSKDLFGISLDSAKTYANNSRKLAHTSMRSAEEKINNNQKRLLEELRRVLNSNYVFTDTNMREDIRNWITCEDAYIKEANKEFPAVYVYIRPQVNNNQIVEYSYVKNLRDAHTILKEEMRLSYISDLKADFVGKLSVLSLLKDGDYVENVGLRVSESVYWVEVENESAIE